MIIHHLQSKPPPELSRALEKFEKPFRYPLGSEQFFHITHGRDYPRFFRAMGEANCFVAERDGHIMGVLSASLRHLTLPSGNTLPVVYFGDLKIDQQARGGSTLHRLIESVKKWIKSRASCAYSVVMDGTAAIPPRYTGRLGIPFFREMGKLSILQLAADSTHEPSDSSWISSAEKVQSCYLKLTRGRYACIDGNPEERSEIQPVWIMDPDGRACGRLEDTRRAKRLITDEGTEIRSAHLSCFAYQHRMIGAQLLQVALRVAASRNFPDMFVAIPHSEASSLCDALDGLDPVIAPATVFGTGLQSGPLWNINTAEI